DSTRATPSPRRSPASCSSAATRRLRACSVPNEITSPSATTSAGDSAALMAWSAMFTGEPPTLGGCGAVGLGGCGGLAAGVLGRQHFVLEDGLDQLLHVLADR